MTGANVQGTDFTSTTSKGFTAAQLYSTASYQAHNLTGTSLSANNLNGWNLAGQDLTSASLSSATLSSANLSSATLTNANLSSATLTGESEFNHPNQCLAHRGGLDRRGNPRGELRSR